MSGVPLDSPQLARVRKRAWSRERCEELRAVAWMLDDDEARDIVADAAAYMLEVRQAFRGGRLEVRGSRHWPSQ